MQWHAFLLTGLGLITMGSGGGYDPVTEPAATPVSEARCRVLTDTFVEVASAVDWGSYRYQECGGFEQRPYEETAEFEAYRQHESELLNCVESSAVSIAALSAHENEFVRLRARRILDFWGPRAAAALPALVKQLESASESREREALIQLLGSVGAGSGEIVAPLLEIIRSSRWYDHGATEMLQRTGPDGVAALGEALSDPEERVRIAAAKALSTLGPAAVDALPALMRLLGDANRELHAVTSALAAIGEPAIAPLGRAVQSADRRTRDNAAGALSRFGALGVDVLIDALSQDDPVIQKTALRGLISSGPAAAPAIPLVIGFLESGDREFRLLSTEALGRIRQSPSVVVPELIRMLDDPDRVVRKTAASTLGRWGPEAEAAVPALTRRLPMELYSNRYVIIKALGQMGPHAASALPALRAVRDQAHTDSDYDRRTRYLIDKAIAQIENR